MSFLILWGITSIFCVLFAVPICIIREDFKSVALRILQGLLIGIAFSFFFSGAIHLDHASNANIWNDGNCPNCQQEWQFVNASHGKNTTFYYWQCPNCKDIIELDYQF